MPEPSAADTIRVFIVDDHPLIRHGLAAMIDGEADLERVGEAGSAEEAAAMLAPLAPDVVLMDHIMGRMDGIAATAMLSASLPNTKFVILTSLVEPELVQRAMAAGARGFVLKTASAHELVATIRNVHAGRRVLDAHATGTAVDSYGQPIDADNRAHVTLTSTAGTVALSPGAAINVSYPDAASDPQGQVAINAPRVASGGTLSDVAVSAPAGVTVTGAASIDVYAFKTYTPTDANGTIVQDNGTGDSGASASATNSAGTLGIELR